MPRDLEAGVELDALVAVEVMGWHLVKSESWGPGSPANDCWADAGKIQTQKHEFSPSTDWSAAGEVLEKAKGPAFTDALMKQFGIPLRNEMPHLAICVLIDRLTPLSICLAALKAVRTQKSSGEPSTPQ